MMETSGPPLIILCLQMQRCFVAFVLLLVDVLLVTVRVHVRECVNKITSVVSRVDCLLHQEWQERAAAKRQKVGGGADEEPRDSCGCDGERIQCPTECKHNVSDGCCVSSCFVAAMHSGSAVSRQAPNLARGVRCPRLVRVGTVGFVQRERVVS